MGKIIRPKTHEEWLQVRRSGIGSSEVATIMHCNPFDTPYQLWRRKTGQDPDIPENFAMRAGHYLEDAVAKFFHDESGVQIIKRSATDWIVQDTDRPYMQVSPDRTFWLPGMPHNNANKGILECKTTQLTVDPSALPLHWFCQVQYQLGVAGMQRAALAWLTQGREFGYRWIDFDPDFFGEMVEQVERFWVDCIKGGQEPLSANLDDILIKHPRHIDGKAVIADAELADSCDRLKEIKEQLAALDNQKKELESAIKMAMADAEYLVFDDKPLASWKASKDVVKFDEKRFAAERPDLYSAYQYCAPGSRRFLLK